MPDGPALLQPADAPANEIAAGRLLAALPQGWRALGRARMSQTGPATGCHALAHPAVGVALVDTGRVGTREAEARLRRVLRAAPGWQAHAGVLPILHCRVLLPADLRHLGSAIAQGFSALPPLTIRADDWVDALRAALATDAGWTIEGSASAAALGGEGLRPHAPNPTAVAPVPDVQPAQPKADEPRADRSTSQESRQPQPASAPAAPPRSAPASSSLPERLAAAADRAPEPVMVEATPRAAPGRVMALWPYALAAACVCFAVGLGLGVGWRPSELRTAAPPAREVFVPIPTVVAPPDQPPIVAAAPLPVEVPRAATPADGALSLAERPAGGPYVAAAPYGGATAAAPDVPRMVPIETAMASPAPAEVPWSRGGLAVPRAEPMADSSASVAAHGGAVAFPADPSTTMPSRAPVRAEDDAPPVPGPPAFLRPDAAGSPTLAPIGAARVDPPGSPAPDPPSGVRAVDPAPIPPTGALALAPAGSDPPRAAALPEAPPGDLLAMLWPRVPPADGPRAAAPASAPADLPLPPEAMPPRGGAARAERREPPPTRQAAVSGSRLDRRCSDALFRWQTGETLSAADRTYLRDGCGNVRR